MLLQKRFGGGILATIGVLIMSLFLLFSVQPAHAQEGDAENQELATCEDTQGTFGFFICPVILTLGDGIEGIYNFIIDAMHFSLFQPANNDGRLPNGGSGLPETAYDKVYQSWQFVSRLALTVIVIAFLIMVIGQAVSNLFDAYSMKKILPRLIIAIIAIFLSWYIVTFFIEVGNVIGAGVRDIILSPFQNAGGDANAVVDAVTPGGTDIGDASGTTIFGLVAGGAGITSLFFTGIASWLGWMLLSIFLPLLVGLIIAFAVLILRQGLLIALTIFAPLAIALWVLPGTSSVFDKWRGILTGLVLFYPVFQAVVATCAMLAIVIGLN